MRHLDPELKRQAGRAIDKVRRALRELAQILRGCTTM
jgi:hypothetical protein